MQTGQADVYIFGDEAGNPGDFQNLASNRYFIVVTATLRDLSWLTKLDGLGQALRGKLGILKIGLPFHAAKDNPQVKREVLHLIHGEELRVDATIVDKQAVRPELQHRHRLYAAIWASHLVNLLRDLNPRPSRANVTVASIGTAANAKAFRRGAERAMREMRAYGNASSSVLGLGQLGFMRLGALPVLVLGNHSSPSIELGLQVADYCAWPIQRKWERRDRSAYDQLKSKIRSERLITL
jgi:hypothetical protein